MIMLKNYRFKNPEKAYELMTIANDGKRVQPHILKKVREPSNESGKAGGVIEEFQTNVLNTVDMDLSYIERVQNGFHRVMN